MWVGGGRCVQSMSARNFRKRSHDHMSGCIQMKQEARLRKIRNSANKSLIVYGILFNVQQSSLLNIRSSLGS